MAMRSAPTILEDTNIASPPPADPSERRPVLVLLDGDDARRVFVLQRGETTLGRDPTCTLPAHDSTCSRKHARVIVEPGESGPRVIVEDLQSTNGTYVNGERVGRPLVLREHDKVRVGATTYAYLLRDDQELEADQRLLELATVDVLTGLLNRGALDRDMVREFERARRYGRPLSLLLLDLDHFKRVNDTYGHPVGDRALALVGRLLRATVRTCDVAGRYGGEELAVVLTETARAGAEAAAERLRVAVEEMGFGVNGAPVPLRADPETGDIDRRIDA
ncbi:MAG: diguanylate cyclase [Myxococcota bacterium]